MTAEVPAMSACRAIITVARRLGLRRFWRRRPPPGNLQALDASPEAVKRDAEYGFQCGRRYLDWMKKLGVTPKNACVLEIGPGPAFGAMAYLAAHGAKVCVADRWLAAWQSDYHGKYYAALTRLIDEAKTGGDARLIGDLASKNGYENGPVLRVCEPAEALCSIADESFDIIFSNAVLEHLARPAQAFAELGRITRNGGCGVHQVDFRDHRDFEQPLEHLLLDPSAFQRLTKIVHYEYGSQLRREDYAALFEAAGFSVIDYQSNDRAAGDYLDAFKPRLERAARSPYRALSRERLADLGGLFFVRRSSCAA